MAKVINDDPSPQTIYSSYQWWRVALVGVGLGVLFFILTLVMEHYVINPLNCHFNSAGTACSDSLGVSGSIASVLVAIIGTGTLIRFRIARPVIISIAAAVLLWGLASWTNGLLWIEELTWSAVLYGLSYALFSWVARYSRGLTVIVTISLIVLVARVILIR